MRKTQEIITSFISSFLPFDFVPFGFLAKWQQWAIPSNPAKCRHEFGLRR